MPETQPTLNPATLKRAGVIGAVMLVLVLAGGTAARLIARHSLSAYTAEQAIPSVNVVHPAAVAAGALTLPGRIQAWQEAPVYARTNGYLRKWYADIGTHVHAGELLAEIDAPELDQQLQAAEAALATADAQRSLAATSSSRWDRLVGQKAVSQQEADERRGDLAARNAMRNEAQANVDRLRALAGFKRIVAPFDGVVTSRATDVGALIAAGDSKAVPLFTVSDTSKLRIYVNVPENSAGGIKSGMTAQFTVPEYPQRTFTAELARTSEAVSMQSGAMLIQLIADNRDGVLKPGGYAQVKMDLPESTVTTAVRVPASALLFRQDGMAVAVVNENNTITIKPVQISQDLGASVEIASGLARTDRLVDSPSDAIASGDKVRVNSDDSKPDSKPRDKADAG